jgi:hypothetical protein
VECEIHIKHNSTVNRNPDCPAQRAPNKEQDFLIRIFYIWFYINIIFININIIIVMRYSNTSGSWRRKLL